MARKSGFKPYTPKADHSAPPPKKASKTPSAMQAQTDPHLQQVGIGRNRAKATQPATRATSKGGGKSSSSAKPSTDPKYCM